MQQSTQYTFLNARQASEASFQQFFALLEAHFDVSQDPDQIQINPENVAWIKNRIPECLQVIEYENKFVGASLTIPCTKKLMHQFIANDITEAELAHNLQTQNCNYAEIEAIYLCFAIILPEHQGCGLAYKGLTNSIHQILPAGKKVDICYWPYSAEGQALALKIARNLDFPAYPRQPEA